MQKRLFIVMSCALSMIIALTGVIAIFASRQSASKQVDAQLKVSWGLVQDGLYGVAHEEYPERVTELGQPGTLRITIIDQVGTVLGESDSVPESWMENHLGREEVQHALKYGSGYAQRVSATEQQQFRYYAEKTNDGLIIRVATPMLLTWSYIQNTAGVILLAVLFAVLVTVLFTFLYSREMTRPLTAWADWAASVAGDPLHPAPQPEAEDSRLSEPLRLLVDRLGRTVLQLSHQTSELDAILSGMSSGLIALSESRGVTMMNRQAREWFGVDGFEVGCTLEQATGEVELDALLKGQDEVEIVRGGRPITAKWMSVEVKAGAPWGLIWLEDTSEQRSVEKLRREFAANVSHELKTPLMAIQAAADSLRAEDMDTTERETLLGMIEHEVGWLSTLMSDLLTLNRVESMYRDFDVEELQLTDIIGDVLRAQTAAARKREVEIKSEVDDVTVMANYGRIRQLVGNLVDNAIKYNRVGGRVEITAKAMGETLHLSVTDTGIGIPEESQARVFERFYRVDVSHSRAVGGTGLGLSIVKHIVKLMGGRATVSSACDEGTRFDIWLPIVQLQ